MSRLRVAVERQPGGLLLVSLRSPSERTGAILSFAGLSDARAFCALLALGADEETGPEWDATAELRGQLQVTK